MALIASAKSGTDFDPIPAGIHQAVCYGIVDLGTQPSNNPQFKPARKVAFVWELPYERGQFEKDGKKQDLPRATSAIYTLSLSDKANLRKMLQNWRARPFTPEELAAFDLKNVLGANCQLTVVHKPGTGQNASKIYANVEGVNPLAKGMTKTAPENTSLWFSFEEQEGTIAFPQNMPEWIKAKIMQSEEYIAQSKDHVEPPPSAKSDSVDEDVPF